VGAPGIRHGALGDSAGLAGRPTCHSRFDHEACVGVMRIRGVRCDARDAEAFSAEQALLETESDCSVN